MQLGIGEQSYESYVLRNTYYLCSVYMSCHFFFHIKYMPTSVEKIFRWKMFLAVILKTSKKKVVVPERWFKEIDGNFGIVFYSVNEDAEPNFENIYRYFDFLENRCYYGHVLNQFRKIFIFHVSYFITFPKMQSLFFCFQSLKPKLINIWRKNETWLLCTTQNQVWKKILVSHCFRIWQG